MQRTRPGGGNQIEEQHAQIEEKRRIRTREVDEITGLQHVVVERRGARRSRAPSAEDHRL